MEHALVVFDTENTALAAEAGELAAGVDASVTVLALMTEDEYEDVAETLDTVAQEEHTGYDDSVALDAVRSEAREALADQYNDLGLEWDVVAAVADDDGEAADRIVEAGEEEGADHVFVTGAKRSPTGKAVFGDRAQAVILNFDGPVTTLLD
jgi:nucleotide-binding universal stress UspA family protein